MTIVTPGYRPKPAPRKERKQPLIAKRIVTPAKPGPNEGGDPRLGREVP
jgi:hypothetical protein